jgi:DNA uptake protein ComE-like DNA-binding protein
MQIYITPEGMSQVSHDPNQHNSLVERGWRLLDDINPQSGTIAEGRPKAIDINTATLKQLAELGLSVKTAKAIAENRPYTSVSGLAAIDGLNLAAIESKITVINHVAD